MGSITTSEGRIFRTGMKSRQMLFEPEPRRTCGVKDQPSSR